MAEAVTMSPILFISDPARTTINLNTCAGKRQYFKRKERMSSLESYFSALYARQNPIFLWRISLLLSYGSAYHHVMHPTVFVRKEETA